MARKLVAFFSASGTTRKAAQKLAKEEGADIFEIKPVVPYTSADLNWMDKQSRSTLEMRDKSSRVEIAEKVENMDQYDTIILGYPNWWGLPPMAVFTFLESYDFAGKKIVPFCSHEGSGLGGSIRQIKMSVPEARLTAGVAIHGAAASHCDREVKLILEQAK